MDNFINLTDYRGFLTEICGLVRNCQKTLNIWRPELTF